MVNMYMMRMNVVCMVTIYGKGGCSVAEITVLVTSVDVCTGKRRTTAASVAVTDRP